MCRGNYISVTFCKDHFAAVWETDSTEAQRGGGESGWRSGRDSVVTSDREHAESEEKLKAKPAGPDLDSGQIKKETKTNPAIEGRSGDQEKSNTQTEKTRPGFQGLHLFTPSGKTEIG